MHFTDIVQSDAAQLPPHAANVESNEGMNVDMDMDTNMGS